MKNNFAILTLLFGLLPICNLQADVITSTDTNNFALQGIAITDTTLGSSTITSDNGVLQLDIAPVGDPVTSSHIYSDFSLLLPGSEYVLSGDENFDLTFNSNQTAFAMDYADDADDSVFTLNFFDGLTNVGSASFTSNAPFAQQKFIGFASDTPFNRVEIREDDGAANTNEYFQFYTATAVPEPSSMIALGGLATACLLRRRRRAN